MPGLYHRGQALYKAQTARKPTLFLEEKGVYTARIFCTLYALGNINVMREDRDDFLEEPNEFERRQRGAKRETAKRKRAAEKVRRQELQENEISRKASTDKRAQAKELKRRYSELKRIANTLDIKEILEQLAENCAYTCWGPDLASDKTKPYLGVFLNYTEHPLETMAGDSDQQLTPALVGVWLFYAGPRQDQVYLTVGTHLTTPETNHQEQAAPPPKAQRLLTLPYLPSDHSVLHDQVSTALLAWGKKP